MIWRRNTVSGSRRQRPLDKPGRCAVTIGELPLLGSNQDSPDPESGVLPVTPRGTGTKRYTAGPFGQATISNQIRGEWGVVRDGASRAFGTAPLGTTPHSLRLSSPTSPHPHAF